MAHRFRASGRLRCGLRRRFRGLSRRRGDLLSHLGPGGAEGAASYPAAGLAMARTCDVRRRIAMLRQRVFAAALGRRAVVGAVLVGLLSLAVLAGVRLALAVGPGGPGRVADAKGQGIANATVKRLNSSWSARTNVEGYFPLPGLKSGETAQLSVSAKGFSALRVCRIALPRQ